MKVRHLLAAGYLLLATACVTGPQTAPQFQTHPANAPIGVSATIDGQPAGGVELELHTLEKGTTNADGYFQWPSMTLGPRHLVALKGECRGERDVEPKDGTTWPIALVCPEPPKPAFISTNRPLVGPLRVQDKLLRDDTGYRRVFFASWFTALRTLRDNPDEFMRQLDVIAAKGYQGYRLFSLVGGWSKYWDGAEVVPVPFTKWFYTGNHLRTERLGARIDAWPDYDDLLRTLARETRKRGLRLEVTIGDSQIVFGCDAQSEIRFARRTAAILAQEGGLDLVALVEGTNEFPINRCGGDSDASVEQLGRVLAVWRELIPGVLTTEGAVISEEPEKLYLGAKYGQVAAVHVSRDPVEMHLKRSFGIVNFEGNWRVFPVPFWHTEPAGPGDDSYARVDNTAILTAIYAQHALLGNGSTYFNGPAVRGCIKTAGEVCLEKGPLESTWGFAELPKLLAETLPEDVATWDHASDGRGGVMYWSSGNDFRAVLYETWSAAPPRPIADWTLYAGDHVEHGTGTPPPKKTGLLVGRFQ